jgi:hypothetical protein
MYKKIILEKNNFIYWQFVKGKALSFLKKEAILQTEIPPIKMVGERKYLPYAAYAGFDRLLKAPKRMQLTKHNNIYEVSGLERACEKSGTYEIVTYELVAGIIDLIMQTGFNRSLQGKNEPIRIMEAGAGNGKLSYFVDKALSASGLPYEFLAINEPIDEKSDWQDIKVGENVELIEQRKGVQEFKPYIIISSWMPPGEDWTSYWRSIASVESYIIIGTERAGVQIGCIETYGIESQLLKPLEKLLPSAVLKSLSPYLQDGFSKTVLKKFPTVSRAGRNMTKIYFFEKSGGKKSVVGRKRSRKFFWPGKAVFN